MIDLEVADFPLIASGQVWTPKNGGSTWRVKGISTEGDMVSIIGPGACNQYRVIDVDVFIENWERVDLPN